MAAQPAPASADASIGAETDALFRVGQQLFEQLAPAEVKAQYEFPTKERFDAMVAKFKRALEGDSLDELASCAAEGRSALSALRMVPGYEDLADWLEQRIDEFEGAQQLTSVPLGSRRQAYPVPLVYCRRGLFAGAGWNGRVP